MAATKLSNLTEATSLADADLIYVVEGLTSKKITKETFIAAFNVEKRTSDYAASAANVGKIWTRTDTGEVKTVTDTGGAYAVEELNKYTTDAEIKTAYENNADTNAFTDAEKTKLGTVEDNATQFAFAEPRTSDYAATAENSGKIWQRTNTATPSVKMVAQTVIAGAGSWTASTDLNSAQSDGLSFGVATSGIIAGGTNGSTSLSTSQEWDDSTWSSANAMANVRGGSTSLFHQIPHKTKVLLMSY